MSGKRTDLAALVSGGQRRAEQPQPVEPAPPLVKRERREVVKLAPEVGAEARNAVWFLRTQGVPAATLAGLVGEAVRRELDRLRAEHGIDAFPEGHGALPAGRPLGR